MVGTEIARRPTSTHAPIDESEALIPEARRRQRRRRALITALTILVIGSVAIIIAITRSGTHHPARGGGATPASALPMGPITTLRVAGPLTVAPDGALYVADLARDQVLVRLRSGRFRVIAGNGKTGLGGDGGPALRAELARVSDLAVTPNGALDIADAGRVRQVTPDGTIHTIAGNGRGRANEPVANGQPALSAALGSARAIATSGAALSIAVSPAGELYISTGSQILRLTAGKLEIVPAYIRTRPFVGNLNGRRGGFGPIAIDAHGNIDIAGVNGWSIWQIAHGIADRVGTGLNALARRSGGDYSILERGPDGTVFAESGPHLLRISGKQLVPSFTFAHRVAGEYFWLTYFAFAPKGTIYADEIPGGTGFETHQQLLSITHGHLRLLWEQ